MPRRATWSASASFRNLFRWQRQHISFVDPIDGMHVDCWEQRQALRFTNPLSCWEGMTTHSTAVAVTAWLAAFVDSFDFHALALQIVKLAAYYGVSKGTMASAITLTMLFRMGAAIWGIVADAFGRRAALTTNLWFLALMQIASIYASSFPAFLATRAFFGVGMGGIFGCGASWAFESIPVRARGVYSGIFQSAFPISYIVAAAANLAIGPAHWPTLFAIGAGLSFAVGCFRAILPEEPRYLEARKAGHATKAFFSNFRKMMVVDWPVMLYISVLVAWLLVHGHALQDSYVTFLVTSKGFNNSQASRNAIYAKLGATFGSLAIAYFSQSLGRRRTMIVCLIIAAAVLPAAVIPTSEGALGAGAFWLQAWAQSWSVIPIYLSEICHPSWRALVVGLSYQVGAALSSPTTQVVNILAERFHTVTPEGRRVEAYGPVMAIVSSIAVVVIVVLLAFGPERLGTRFEEAPLATEEDEGKLSGKSKGHHADGEVECEASTVDEAGLREKSSDKSLKSAGGSSGGSTV